MSATSLKVPPTRTFCSNPWSRLIWKEFRQNLPVLFVFVGLMFFIATMQYRTELPGMELWCTGSWGVLCLFAITIGIYLFSPEFENKTSSILQQLPVSSGFVVKNKILIGISFLFTFLVIAFLLQAFQVFGLGYSLSQSGEIFDDPERTNLTAVIGAAIIVPVECFICGVVCSLAIRRAIFAIFAAFGLVLLGWFVLAVICSTLLTLIQPADDNMVLFFVFSTKFLLLLLLASSIFPLSKRWLGNAPQIGATDQLPSPPNSAVPLNSQTKHQNLAVDSLGAADSSRYASASISRSRVKHSLIWQTFRQQRIHLIVFAVLIGLTACYCQIYLEYAYTHRGANFSTYIAIAQYGAVFMGLACLLCGQLAFAADNQNDKYRFFQQHGDFPWTIWSIRLTPAFLLTLLCFVIVFVQYFWLRNVQLEYESYGVTGHDCDATTLRLLLIIFSAFAIGQYNSIFFKSIVFSVAMNLLLSIGLWSWFLFLYEFHGNYLAYFMPIPVAMCLATWLWSPHWIAGENKTLRVLIPHSIVAGLTTVLVVLFLAMNKDLIWS